mmetsp:Transcript_99710/g.321226  ORF Transcript_99710/g.321226 Transcript_99710/m.321226 type:complete len:285 (+) Transcript_99710:109-963(+)
MGQAAAKFLQHHVESRRPGALKQLEGVFGFIPQELREGPWAWAPTLVVAALAQGIFASAPSATAAFAALPEAPGLAGRRLGGFGFGAAVLLYMLRKWGSWPMVSWTMLGWTCTTMRYLAGGLGYTSLQRALTFPSLFANSVTVLVWYLGVVPGILVITPKGKRRKAFNNMIMSWFLFLVHGMNFPFSFADWYVQPVRLDLFDLWAGFAYGLLYITFYLAVLDPIGVHLYFILSPRKWWGALVYAGIVLLGASIWAAVNALEARLLLAAGAGGSGAAAAGPSVGA